MSWVRYSLENRILLKRLVGLLLIVSGVLLFYLLTPTAVSSDLIIIPLVTVWLIVSIIGFGSSLLFNLELKYSLKMLALVFAFGIPWSLIFYIPLPGNSQHLVALLVAGIAIFFIRRYSKNKIAIKSH